MNPELDQLSEQTPAYDFFQAVSILEHAAAGSPIGYSSALRDDPLRFRHSPPLGFAPTELCSFETTDSENAEATPVLTSCFLGLLGPDGPLPAHLTTLVMKRPIADDKAALRAFFDLFHHRVLSFFYRAWADSRLEAQQRRSDEYNRFRDYLGSLIGIGSPAFQNRDSIPHAAKLFFSGRLAMPTANAEGLRAILSHFFQVSVAVEPLIGRWIDLPTEYQSRVGRGEASALGATTILGRGTYESQQSFRLIFGPMDFDKYKRFLPNRKAIGDGLRQVADWLKLYLKDPQDWSVQLLLKQDQVPRPALGVQGCVGQTIWLSGRAKRDPAGDLILSGGSCG